MKYIVKFFTISLIISVLYAKEGLSLECIRTSDKDYDLIFEGKVLDKKLIAATHDDILSFQTYEATLEIQKVVKGNLKVTKTQKISYSIHQDWGGPQFPDIGGSKWVYAKCSNSKCHTELCYLTQKPEFADSPIHYSACFQELDIFQYKARPFNIYKYYPSDDLGETVLTTAIRCKNYEVVRYLLDQYPKLANITEKSGSHPLFLSIILFNNPNIQNSDILEKIFNLTDLEEVRSIKNFYPFKTKYVEPCLTSINTGVNALEFAKACASKDMYDLIYNQTH